MFQNTFRFAGCFALLALTACSGDVPDDSSDVVRVDTAEQAAVLALDGSTTADSPLLISTRLPTPYVRPPKGGDPYEGKDSFSAYEAHLAALGSATLDCLGTTGPKSYEVRNGLLAPAFDSCPLDGRRMEDIKNLLAIQNTDLAPGAADFFVRTWSTWLRAFPVDAIQQCPSWEKVGVINPPHPKYLGTLGEREIGKENYVYRVKSEQCGDKPECAVDHALQCAGAYGKTFLIGADYEKAGVTVDPVYWLLNTEYPPDANPFTLTPGYAHLMSYYGAAPGAVFGAPNRAGEYCSKLISGYHFKNRKLGPVDCGDGYICMTMCN